MTLDQDIDIIVLNSILPPEAIKELLVFQDPNFFLVPSTNPRNTYKVLWYRLDGDLRQACKIDILVPGIMNIPAVPSSLLVYSTRSGIHGAPVIPFLALLLMKLQGWTDHRESRRNDMRQKQHVDVLDIHELLLISLQHGGLHIRSESWLPESFVTEGRVRVQKFVISFPETRWLWQSLGLIEEGSTAIETALAMIAERKSKVIVTIKPAGAPRSAARYTVPIRRKAQTQH